MQELLLSVQSAEWWVSVFIAGLFVNLLAAYAKPAMDRLFSRLSSRVRLKARQIAEERDAVRRALEINVAQRALAAAAAINFRVKGIGELFLGSVSLIAAVLLVLTGTSAQVPMTWLWIVVGVVLAIAAYRWVYSGATSWAKGVVLSELVTKATRSEFWIDMPKQARETEQVSQNSSLRLDGVTIDSQ